MDNKPFDFSSKKRIFAQKRPNLARNWHFSPLLAHLVPCWGLVGGCGAGCISQDTYLLYVRYFVDHKREGGRLSTREMIFSPSDVMRRGIELGESFFSMIKPVIE